MANCCSAKKFIGGFMVLCVLGAIVYRINIRNPKVEAHQELSNTLESEEQMFVINGDTIKTPYGTFEVKEQVLHDLIESAAFQRIKHIQQYGVMQRIKYTPPYSRYAHCLGVWAILRRFNAPLNEQIAGLLHDASHTVFSHLGDHVFNHTSEKNSYQDDIHAWFLRKYGIDKILMRHGIELRDVLHKGDAHKMAEQDLPDLCADRIEYNLRGGLNEGLINKQEIEEILAALSFADEKWFFTNKEAALKFSKIPLFLTVHEWGSPANMVVSTLVAQAIRRALDLQIVTFDEVHFSTDAMIWDRLEHARDAEIVDAMQKAQNYKELHTLAADPADADKIFKTKFRGVDPLIYFEGKMQRLTEVDETYAADYAAVQAQMKQGWPIKFADGFKL